MEFLHAILFTARYIFGDGNYDLYYVFLGCVFTFYLIRKGNYVIKIFKCYLPFFFIGLVMLIGYPHLNIIKFCVYEAKVLLCVTSIVYIQTNYHKVNWDKFIGWVCIVLGCETVVALVWQTNVLWRLNDLINGYTTKRLELLYLEPSSLGMHCGLIALILFWAWWNNKKNRHIYVGAFVLLVDMLLCASLSGILGFVIAGVVMALYTSFKYYYGSNKVRVKQFGIYLTIPIMLILINVKKGAMVQRVHAVIAGADSSFISRFIYPVRTLAVVLSKTSGRGVGFGNLNTEYGLGILGGTYKYSCSFPYFIAEAGYFAIIIIGLFAVWFFRLCLKSRDALCWGLFFYVLVTQIAGGYFTDPLIYAIYGLIIGRAKTIEQEDKYCEKKAAFC